MELCWFVRNTEPFFIVDSLKALAGDIFGKDHSVIPEFQRKMNRFSEVCKIFLVIVFVFVICKNDHVIDVS